MPVSPIRMPSEGKREDSKSPEESKRPSQPKAHSVSEAESKRSLRWLSFAKPKVVFGFEHLTANRVPSTSSSSRGLSVCFDHVQGWNIPAKVIEDVTRSWGKLDLSIQLSLSLFHFNSGYFFGSTWIGFPIYLEDQRAIEQAVLNIDYNEVIYLVSRISDPSCIGVVELICNKIDHQKSLIVAQYGCGWSILNLFIQPFPPDIAEGPENAHSMSVPVYKGSPRDLVLNSDVTSLTSRLKEVQGSKLFYRIFSHRKLIPVARLIAENELVGRFEVVPGLVAKEVMLPNSTTSTSIACIGEEQYNLSKKGVVVVPSRPVVAMPLSLKVEECYFYIPDRIAVETRMRNAVLKSLGLGTNNEIRILSRTLKIGNLLTFSILI